MFWVSKNTRKIHAQRKAAALRKEKARYVDGNGKVRRQYTQ